MKENKPNYFYIFIGFLFLFLPIYFIYLKYHNSFDQGILDNYSCGYNITEKDVEIKLFQNKKEVIAKIERKIGFNLTGAYLDSVIGVAIFNQFSDRIVFSGIKKIIILVKIYPENRKYFDDLSNSKIEKDLIIMANEKDSVKVRILRIGNQGTITVGDGKKQISCSSVLSKEAIQLFHETAVPKHCWTKYTLYEKHFVLE